MRIELPYGKTAIPMEAEPERVVASKIDEMARTRGGETLVAEAMANPIGSPPLWQLARGKRTAVLILSDHTRPVPSRDIVPQMLAELRRGNPAIEITLLVAAGCHRGTTRDELREKLGDEILNQERIVIHDAFDERANVEIGTLPSSAPLAIDRVAAETDLLVAEGFIEPHFFAGFSGGRKSVLPGICAQRTVLGNHCGAFIHSDRARTGILDGNPIHADMEAGAALAKLQYIVNVVIDREKRAVAAFAGDFRAAHAAGVAFLRRYCQVPPVRGDVVVTTNGGAPLDQNLYQCVKGLTAAEATARPGAALILCAALGDGVGGEQFYRDMRRCTSPAALYESFRRTPRDETVQDQWQTQILCRVLMRHRVIFVTEPGMAETIREMKMEYAPDLPAALRMAGPGEVTVVPDGVSVCICEEGSAL